MNEIYGTVKALLFADTDMNEEEFKCKFNSETIIDQFLEVVTSDGTVHKLQISTLLELKWGKQKSHAV